MTTFRSELLAVFASCLLILSCAQTGPPLPPSLELPKPPSDLRVARKGSRVTLTWTEPTRTTDRQSVRYLGPTRICRSISAEMKECGEPVGQLPPPSRPLHTSDATDQQPLMFVDTLPSEMSQKNPTGDITYAVEVLNRDGRSAGLSTQVRIAAVPTPPLPPDFHAQLTARGVEFTWSSAGEAPSQVIQHRYRIYRRGGAGIHP